MPFFWVYILSCQNDCFYTGYTDDLIKRYQLHAQGKAAKFTRSFPPIQLAQAWPIYGLKRQAMRIERFIKKMTKIQKQSVIDNPVLLQDQFIIHLSNSDIVV